jgi:hypothetical protein
MCAFNVFVQSRNRGSRFGKPHTSLDPEDEEEEEEEATVLNTFVCLYGKCREVSGRGPLCVLAKQPGCHAHRVIWHIWLWHAHGSIKIRVLWDPVGLKPKTTLLTSPSSVHSGIRRMMTMLWMSHPLGTEISPGQCGHEPVAKASQHGWGEGSPSFDVP